MKLSKLFIMFLFWGAIFVAGNVQGNDLILHTGLPKDLPFFENPVGKLHQFDDLTFTFRTITSRIHFNYDSAKNRNEWNSGNDASSRIMHGASIDYKITDFFYVASMFAHYELEKLPGGYITQPDSKKEWFGGFRFRFEF